jgi:hypothetical protein
MLKQKALTRTLTATLCTSTNTVFVHKRNKAHLQYTVNSLKVIRNLSNAQLNAFTQLQNTCMQNAKQFVTNNALIQKLYNN